MSIVTLTGAPGSGKSVSMYQLVMWKVAMLIQSSTSRHSRHTDLVGEYEYVLPELLEEQGDRYLWVHKIHESSYAVAIAEIERFLSSKTPGIICLSPPGVEELHRRYPGKVTSFFLMSPADEAILELNMQRRGHKEDDIPLRMAQGREWVKHVQETPNLYHFLPYAPIQERAYKIAMVILKTGISS